MKIGIPKGLSTYEYPILFTKFFELLNIEVVFSDETSKEILQKGIENSIDESCLASKIYMGHIANLVERREAEHIDYIFVPRLAFFKNKETICVKFYALYDICKNVFNASFVTLNIDYSKGENEFKAFVKLGKRLGKKYSSIVSAYIKAQKLQKQYDLKLLEEQNSRFIQSKYKQQPNILIVSHPYITYDSYLGVPICDELKRQNANLFFSDINSRDNKSNGYTNISRSVYWKPSINLLNGINSYLDKIDGIIYLSVFPCGTDSLVNELAIRKITQVPSMNIILDEQDATAGLQTRLESFMDILTQNIELKKVSG